MAKTRKNKKTSKMQNMSFANDQLGENTEPRYEEMKQDKKGGKKAGKK